MHGLKINVEKSKALVTEKDQMGSCERVRVRGEEMKDVDKIHFLGVIVITDDGIGKQAAHRVLKGRKLWGTMAKIWREK